MIKIALRVFAVLFAILAVTEVMRDAVGESLRSCGLALSLMAFSFQVDVLRQDLGRSARDALLSFRAMPPLQATALYVGIAMQLVGFFL